MNGATFAAGKVGQAFSFDGVNDYVSVPDAPNLDGMSQLTVGAWVKFNSLSYWKWQSIVGKGQGHGFGTNSYLVWFAGDTMKIQAALESSGQLNTLVAPDTVEPGRFYHVAFTYDGATFKLYLNGVLRGSAPFTGTVRDTAYPFLIGQRSSPGVDGRGDALNGVVDEVEIYNRALSASEIQSIYNATPPPVTTWNVVTDFSITSNPNGIWSYGWTASQGSAPFTLMTRKVSGALGFLDGWSTVGFSGDYAPSVHRNTSGMTKYYNIYTYHPPDVLNLHPGPGGQNAVVRWTAPAAGQYQVQGRFEGIDIGSKDVAILRNSTTLFQNYLSSYRQLLPFSLTVTVNPGDTIDFAVGPSGSYYFDSTGLAAIISPVASADTTPPVITTTVNGTLGGNGWYTSNVNVSWSVTDDESEVTSKTGCDTSAVTTDTAGTTSTCSGTSAGGTASRSVSIKRDATAPTITQGDIQGTAGQDGWYRSDVAVAFTTADSLSGLQNAADASFSLSASGEGVAVSTGSRDVYDQAGNKSTAGPLSFKIDRTAPIITGSRTPAANAAGWNNGDVTVHFDCSDALSLIATCTADSVVSTEGENRSVAGTATDKAGNHSTATVSGISIDKTPPTLTGAATTSPNEAGWYNGDVTIHWTAGDNLSGIVATPPDSVITGEGTGLAASGSVQDKAGNRTNATSPAVNIDRTAPTVTYSGNARTYTVDQTVAITCAASDALSGIASDTCTSISAPAYTLRIGTNSLSATATDRAGNVGNASTTFTVLVTYDSLGNLTQQFVKNKGIANSLVSKLKAAEAANSRGNVKAKAGAIGAYMNEVKALAGKALTAEQGEILVRLAGAL